MTAETSVGATTDHRHLAATLAPSLVETCDGRLEDITWFKADWQLGGAATGLAVYRLDDGTPIDVVLKLPVVRRELNWLMRLQDENADESLVVPRLYACGDAVAGYDLTWIVMERLAHGPLGLRWSDGHVPRIADAAARFHAGASAFPVDQPPKVEDWPVLIEEARANVRVNDLDDAPRWQRELKVLADRLDDLVGEWRQRDVTQWLHGDLHLANAMSRVALDDGPVSLIDLAEVHAGNWIEDAVYLERQLWARPERLTDPKPVKAMAAARRRLDLPVEDDYARLAMIRRGLLAATAPRFIRSEGHPRHLQACLEWLERANREL